MARHTRQQDRRRGSITPFVLVALLALLAALALAVAYCFLWQTRVEMQNGADAAALAAAAVLADDDTLRHDPALMQALLARARAEAVRFAAFNRVQGSPLDLQAGPDNAADGDLLFGVIDPPRSRQFLATGSLSDPAITFLEQVNTVRIRAQRTRARGNAARTLLGAAALLPYADVVAEAAAMLDRDVIGFRAVGGRPLPLVPTALLSD